VINIKKPDNKITTISTSSTPVFYTNTEKIKYIIVTFRDVTEIRNAQKKIEEHQLQLANNSKNTAIGEMAAGISHEINNPIAGIAFCAEALESRLKELTLLANKSSGQQNHPCIVDFARYLKLIQEEAFRCKNITTKLLDFSRTTEHKREAVSLPNLVQSVLDVTAHLQNSKGKKIEIKEEQPTKAWINAEEIKKKRGPYKRRK
jgi:signal transduction histidine kinase